MSKNMKKAVVDQIILWMVLFTIFVSFLFFVIEYANAIKVKDSTDAVADYIARMIALDKPISDIVAGANNIKDDYFATIQDADLNCVTNNAQPNYQVIINVYTTLTNDFLSLGNQNVHSRTVVFNENSEFQQECFLTLTFN